jgi:hypothetical protein
MLFWLNDAFSSKLLSRKVKCHIYKTLIRPMLTHGFETLAMGKKGEYLLRFL